MGRRLRGLFQNGGFSRVEAFADYISYGTPDRVTAFARDRAVECRDRQLQDDLARHGIASAEELNYLASQWVADDRRELSAHCAIRLRAHSEVRPMTERSRFLASAPL